MWNVTLNVYSSTVCKYLYLTQVFQLHATLFFYSTTRHRRASYFLLPYILLTALSASYFFRLHFSTAFLLSESHHSKHFDDCECDELNCVFLWFSHFFNQSSYIKKCWINWNQSLKHCYVPWGVYFSMVVYVVLTGKRGLDSKVMNAGLLLVVEIFRSVISVIIEGFQPFAL